MRLLTQTLNPKETQLLTKYLASQGIENKVDVLTDLNWESSDYGSSSYKIWIIDEDQLEKAHEILVQFLNDPSNPVFQAAIKHRPIPLEIPPANLKKLKTTSQITNLMIAFCIFIYAWSAFISPQFESKRSSKTFSPLFTSPVKQEMLFDFPEHYEILDEIVLKFGIDSLQEKGKVPTKAIPLLEKLQNTPYWEGIYKQAIDYFTLGYTDSGAPWFEKIQKGQIWRFVSPIFLHGDIFHLLFNLAWLFILGKQIEYQLKPFRYVLFILIVAALSNTAQYLISGPNFIGISGVVCAMLMFIWERQKKAPWEGYQIQRSTFVFMMIFLFGMLGIQIFSFLIEISFQRMLTTPVANTAHISGLLLGWILARIPFFTKKALR